METLACVIHKEKDLRLENVQVDEPAAGQVLVRVGAGGICGSDLHYYLHGGFGTVRVKEPMVLGHEVAGTVEAVGAGVTNVHPGDRVALNPSRACGQCKYCKAGTHQHCLNMKFYGSAMPTPHSQGAFRQLIVAEAYQCELVGDTVSLGEAACAEPLAVALHAVAQIGDLTGKRVLVTGAGPIGSLVVAAARWAGAEEIVVIDLHEAPLRKALEMGADRTVNITSEPGTLAQNYTADKGYFDAVFECTGAPKIYADILPVIKPRGTIVQIGVTGEVPLLVNALVGKEVRLIGAFRFDGEYALSARLIKEGKINVKPIITATLPISRAEEAFELAADRRAQMKVQLTF
ncbi:MAG: gutB [Proteobacteria bacterium]|nr:gutB [Pseudomonadota bacterium]